MSELLLNEEGNGDINELFLPTLSSGIFLFHISDLNSNHAVHLSVLLPQRREGPLHVASEQTQVERGTCLLVGAHV